MLALLILHCMHVSAGPHGWVAWWQPPHFVLGFGWIHGPIAYGGWDVNHQWTLGR